MGLDFRIRHPDGRGEPTDANWSYSGFDAFRRRLATYVGVPLRRMVGFGGFVSWVSYADEPLVPLLDHSDCDGELTAAECARVAPRLAEVLDAWCAQDRATRIAEAVDPYDVRMGRLLVAAMHRVVACGGVLVFC